MPVHGHLFVFYDKVQSSKVRAMSSGLNDKCIADSESILHPVVAMPSDDDINSLHLLCELDISAKLQVGEYDD